MMNLRTLFALGLVILLGTGCASNSGPVLSDISLPALNSPASAYLGERLLMQGRGFTGEVLQIHSLEGKFVKVSNATFCRRSAADKKFVSFDGRAVKFYSFVGSVRSTTNKVSFKRGEVCFSDVWSGCFDSSEADFSMKTNAVCSSPNAVQQIIEYNGKTGNTLNFTYREVYGARISAPVTQNFTMDLNEGNEITYKGARLRIDKATNQEITYSVLRNFITH